LQKNGCRGVAALEFALTLPIWIVFLLGIADGTYFMLVNEKTDRIASTVGDVVTQFDGGTTNATITKAYVNDAFQAAEQLMSPFPFIVTGSETNGTVIVTSVYQATATSAPVIEWQYSTAAATATGPSGSFISVTPIGTTGHTATLPNGLTLNASDNIIISQVAYNFVPMFASSIDFRPLLDFTATLFSAQTINRVAIYKPRLSQITASPI